MIDLVRKYKLDLRKFTFPSDQFTFLQLRRTYPQLDGDKGLSIEQTPIGELFILERSYANAMKDFHLGIRADAGIDEHNFADRLEELYVQCGLAETQEISSKMINGIAEQVVNQLKHDKTR